ncbi:MAG: BLUF domain-containing protein [Henriciella sp.]|nr:BLUF domain-containing protein [Henriciella sp.]
MYRLVYVSTASDRLDPPQIGSILDVSQSNNYERYITGFLAHNDRSFMQALEGDEQEVRDIYARILRDPRHSGIVQIVGEPVMSRAFPDWSMNYYRVDDRVGAASMVVRRDDPVDALLPSNMPRELLHLFAKFLHIR